MKMLILNCQFHIWGFSTIGNIMPSPLLGLELHSDTLFSDNQLLSLFDSLPFFSKKKPFWVVSKKLPKWLVRWQRACSRKMLPFKRAEGCDKKVCVDAVCESMLVIMFRNGFRRLWRGLRENGFGTHTKDSAIENRFERWEIEC